MTIVTPITVTITIPLTHIISITPESAAAITERQIGSVYWYGLLVDDVFTPLVEWKHLLSNKAMRTVLDQALAQVQAAIEALKQPPTPPAVSHITNRKEIVYDRETHDYAMYLNSELVGFERTYHRAEVALDNLAYRLMNAQKAA